jgi:Uncharacterised nucleotidyltransferase
MQDFKADNRWNIIYQAAQEEKIKTLFKLFRTNNIEPILIKGWSVSRYFPFNIARFSMDIDLVVKASDYKASQRVAKATKINVDLHNGLRHLDNVAYTDLFNNSKSVKLHNGYEIRVLSVEDNLRVVCVHWLNDGGIKKDRLWDIYYCVKNRPINFDWEQCLNVVSKTRRKWILVSIAVAHRYFQLPIEDLPFSDEIKKSNFVPNWVYKTLEKEWTDEVTLNPINASLQNLRTLVQQLGKRFPPNPITATIQTNSPINNFPRLPIQLYNMVRRLFPTETNDQSPFNLIVNKFFKRK